MPHNRHGSVQILQCFVQFELLHVADTLFHVGLRVPKFNPSSDTVEHRGGNGRVALLSKSIRDRPDVAIDAEDLLDHDHRAMWLGRRRRQVGLKFMAITRHYRGEFTHGRYPYGAGEGSKRIASRVVEGKAWGAQRAQVEGCARAHTMEIVDNPLNYSGKPRSGRVNARRLSSETRRHHRWRTNSLRPGAWRLRQGQQRRHAHRRLPRRGGPLQSGWRAAR